MAKLNNLKPARGSKKRRKRLGCGESSGLGKTSGRGNKGQKSRSGSSRSPSFEGGQMPLNRRLPKKGFNNSRFQVKFAIVNVSQIEDKFKSGAVVDEKELREKGLISGSYDAIKILGNGDMSKSFIIKADVFSKSAQSKIEAAGGEFQKAE